MRRFNAGWILLLGVSLVVVWSASGSSAAAQEPELFEIVVRSGLTSITPIYETGQPGNQDAIIGFDVTSDVYLITVPVINGILPSPNVNLGDPIGTSISQVRLPAGTYVDKTLDYQTGMSTGTLTLDIGSLSYSGSGVIRWVHDAAGTYQGVRWSDFSMGITEATGSLAGWGGQVVGTRLLVGDPSLTFQSSLTIFRLLIE